MGYLISKKYGLNASQGASNRAANKYIIAHDTGNDNNKGADSGANEASYMKGHWSDAYTHFIVDDAGIYQVGEPGYVAYGAGSVANANSPVQVELAHVNSQSRFNESYKRYIWLLRYYADKYGIPKTLDTGANGTSGIKSHQWVSNHIWGDHQDPYGYLAKWGISKTQFAKDLNNGLGSSNSKPTAKVKPNNDYIQFNPKKVKVTADVLHAYKTTDMKDNQVTKTYHKGQLIDVNKLYVRSTGTTALKTDGGWISGRKDWVNNYYYVDRAIKQIKVLTEIGGYKDAELDNKSTTVKPGVYTVEKLVKRSSGYWSFQLKSGLYITSRKDLVAKDN